MDGARGDRGRSGSHRSAGTGAATWPTVARVAPLSTAVAVALGASLAAIAACSTLTAAAGTVAVEGRSIEIRRAAYGDRAAIAACAAGAPGAAFTTSASGPFGDSIGALCARAPITAEPTIARPVVGERGPGRGDVAGGVDRTTQTAFASVASVAAVLARIAAGVADVGGDP